MVKVLVFVEVPSQPPPVGEAQAPFSFWGGEQGCHRHRTGVASCEAAGNQRGRENKRAEGTRQIRAVQSRTQGHAPRPFLSFFTYRFTAGYPCLAPMGLFYWNHGVPSGRVPAPFLPEFLLYHPI